jgi:hypothetical protein
VGSVEFPCPSSGYSILVDCFSAYQCSCCIGCCDDPGDCDLYYNSTMDPTWIGTIWSTVSPSETTWSTVSPSETITPTSNLTSDDENRYFAIREVLLNVTSATVLDDPSSPQNKAMLWLIDDDLLQVPPTKELVLKERYIVSVLYFAMNGPMWTFNYNFLNGTSICEWSLFSAGCTCFQGKNVIESIYLGTF